MTLLTDVHARHGQKTEKSRFYNNLHYGGPATTVLHWSGGLHTPQKQILRDTVVIYGPVRQTGRIRTYHRAFAADNDGHPWNTCYFDSLRVRERRPIRRLGVIISHIDMIESSSVASLSFGNMRPSFWSRDQEALCFPLNVPCDFALCKNSPAKKQRPDRNSWSKGLNLRI